MHFNTVPKTHDLEAIFNRLKDKVLAISELEEKIRFLNKFYVPTRYPDALPGSLPEGLPDSKDAQKALDYAKEISKYIIKLLTIL